MNGQRIKPKYLDKLKDFFLEHSLEDFQVIYDNENKFAEWLNVKTFKFTNSGTSALYLILKHIKNVRNINRNTSFKRLKVYIPAFCHISSLTACDWVEADYSFIDVSETTLSMDPSKLLDALKHENGRPDVLILTDMGGYVGPDTLRIKEICKEYDITFVEDAAHAFGQSYAGFKAGTFGDYGFFSFSNPKLLTAGEGGAIVSSLDISALNTTFEDYIYQGGWYRTDRIIFTKGLNFIMSNWMTELLAYQLDDIEEILKDHYIKFQEHLAKTGDLIQFGSSDNEFYAPSFFARKQDPVPKILKQNSLASMLFGRYKNMGGINYPHAEKLSQTLIYWKY